MLNKFINNSYIPERYFDINVNNDTILTLGVGYTKLNEKYVQGIVLTQLDTLGSIIKSKIIIDSIRGGLSLSLDYGNIVRSLEEEFVKHILGLKELPKNVNL